jgi:hypothetical protein
MREAAFLAPVPAAVLLFALGFVSLLSLPSCRRDVGQAPEGAPATAVVTSSTPAAPSVPQAPPADLPTIGGTPSATPPTTLTADVITGWRDKLLLGSVWLDGRMDIHADSARWQRDGRTLPWEAREVVTGETYSSLRRVAGDPEESADGSFTYRTVKHIWEYVRCEAEGVAPPGPIELFPNAAPDFRVPECGGARRITVDASWPEVLNGHPRLDVVAANRTLVSLLNGYAPFPTEVAGGSTSARVVAARGRVLSFIVKTDGVFPAAYPDHTEYGVTIDLRDGRHMLTSDLLDVPDPSQFAALLEKRVPSQPAGGGEACGWADVELSVHIGKDGLHLTPDFPPLGSVSSNGAHPRRHAPRESFTGSS